MARCSPDLKCKVRMASAMAGVTDREIIVTAVEKYVSFRLSGSGDAPAG
jgi:hypothetical protein